MAPYQLRTRSGKHSDKRSQEPSSSKNQGKAGPGKASTKKAKSTAQKKTSMASRTRESPATPQLSQALDPKVFERSLAPSPPTLATSRITDMPSIPPLPAVLARAVDDSEFRSPLASPSRTAHTGMSAPHPPSPPHAVHDEEVEKFLATISLSIPQSSTPQTSPPSYLFQQHSSAKLGATGSSSAPGLSAQLDSHPAPGRDIFVESSLSGAAAQPTRTFYPVKILPKAITDDITGHEANIPPSQITDFGIAEQCHDWVVRYHQAMGVTPPPRPSLDTLKRMSEDPESRLKYCTMLRDLTPQYDRLPDLSERKWLEWSFREEHDNEGLGDEEGDEDMPEAAQEEKDNELWTLVETIKTLCGQYNALRQTLQRDAAPDIREDRQRAAWYRRGTAQVHAELERIRAWAAYWNPSAKSMWSTKEVWTGFPIRLKKKDGLWMELAEDEDRGSEDEDTDDEVDASSSTAPEAPPGEPGPSGSQKGRRFSGIRPTVRSPPPPAAMPSDDGEEDGSSDDEEDKPDDGASNGCVRTKSTAPDASQRRRPAYGVIRRPRSHTPESDDSSDSSVIGSDPENPDATGSRISALSAEAQHYLYKVALEQETRQSGRSADGSRNVSRAAPSTPPSSSGPSSSRLGGTTGSMTTPPPTPLRTPPVASGGNAPEARTTVVAAASAAAPVPTSAASQLKVHRPSPPAYVHRPTGQKRERNPRHPGISTRQPELNPRPAKKRRIRYNSSDESDVEEGSSGSLRQPSTPVVDRPVAGSGPPTPSSSKKPAFAVPAPPSQRTSTMGPPPSPPTPPSASLSSPGPSASIARQGRPLVRTATPMNPLASGSSSPHAGTSSATRVTALQDVSDGRRYLVPTDKLNQKIAQLNAAAKVSELNRQRDGLLPTTSAGTGACSSDALSRQSTASSADERPRAPSLSRQVPREVDVDVEPSPPPARVSSGVSSSPGPASSHARPQDHATPGQPGESSLLGPHSDTATAPSGQAQHCDQGSTRADAPGHDPLEAWIEQFLRQHPRASPRVGPSDPSERLRGLMERHSQTDVAPHEMASLTVAHLPEPLRKLWLQTKQITQRPEDDEDEAMQDVEDSFDVERMLEDAPSDAASVQRELEDEVKALADEADQMAAACAAGELTDEQIEGIVNGTLKFEGSAKASKLKALTMRRLPFWKNPNEPHEDGDEGQAAVVDVGGDTESDSDAATEVGEDAPQAGQDEEGGEQGGAAECVGKGKGRADGRPSGSFNLSAK